MECLEFWLYGIMFILAGNLPDAAQALAALGAAMEVYDVVIMAPLAQLITLSTRSAPLHTCDFCLLASTTVLVAKVIACSNLFGFWLLINVQTN